MIKDTWLASSMMEKGPKTLRKAVMRPKDDDDGEAPPLAKEGDVHRIMFTIIAPQR